MNIGRHIFTSIDIKSESIFNSRKFALIGVSPFNSYFSMDRIIQLIKNVAENFDDLMIFIPNKISRYTLQALGYEDQRIHHKVRKQDNYLLNKTIKAFEHLSLNHQGKIVLLSDLIDNVYYNKLYNLCLENFVNDPIFRHGCMSCSSWVLSSNQHVHESVISEESIEIAVQYFMMELPIFLDAPKILNVSHCSFIYHSITDFLKKIYHDQVLVSEKQGFTLLNQQM